jgi:hypothetical protein
MPRSLALPGAPPGAKWRLRSDLGWPQENATTTAGSFWHGGSVRYPVNPFNSAGASRGTDSHWLPQLTVPPAIPDPFSQVFAPPWPPPKGEKKHCGPSSTADRHFFGHGNFSSPAALWSTATVAQLLQPNYSTVPFSTTPAIIPAPENVAGTTFLPGGYCEDPVSLGLPLQVGYRPPSLVSALIPMPVSLSPTLSGFPLHHGANDRDIEPGIARSSPDRHRSRVRSGPCVSRHTVVSDDPSGPSDPTKSNRRGHFRPLLPKKRRHPSSSLEPEVR